MDLDDPDVDFKRIFFEGDYFTLYSGSDIYKCRIYKINNEYPCDHICTINSLDKIETLKSILPLVQV